MNNYKQWTGQQRQISLKMTNQAKRLGLIERPIRCRVCGQTEGIIQHHNKNYDVTLAFLPKIIAGTANQNEIDAVNEVLVPLCWRCHMMHHSRHRNIQAVQKYFDEVSGGKKVYPPVYKHDFAILARDHGV